MILGDEQLAMFLKPLMQWISSGKMHRQGTACKFSFRSCSEFDFLHRRKTGRHLKMAMVNIMFYIKIVQSRRSLSAAPCVHMICLHVVGKTLLPWCCRHWSIMLKTPDLTLTQSHYTNAATTYPVFKVFFNNNGSSCLYQTFYGYSDSLLTLKPLLVLNL